MTLLADLLAARARIDRPEKWCKGPGTDLRRCVMTALPFGSLCAQRLLSRCLPAGPWRRSVIDYNDHPNTTHADIMALYDRAIANERYRNCLRGLA